MRRGTAFSDVGTSLVAVAANVDSGSLRLHILKCIGLYLFWYCECIEENSLTNGALRKLFRAGPLIRAGVET